MFFDPWRHLFKAQQEVLIQGSYLNNKDGLRTFIRNPLKSLVAGGGFEPPTFGL